MIEYVREKYGAQAVSQIVTFGTMSSKAVIRDVGRVLELPFMLCDKLSKLIPLEANKPLSLDDAMKAQPQIQELLEAEEADELITLAKKLEDLTRGLGMHAGGVLIAPGKISDYSPVYQADESASPVSMYDKGDVEDVGLVSSTFWYAQPDHYRNGAEQHQKHRRMISSMSARFRLTTRLPTKSSAMRTPPPSSSSSRPA